MKTKGVTTDAVSTAPEPESFDLGQWLGRHQALACVAHYCSAADAHALLTIRDQKLYRGMSSTWDIFCARYTGMSRATANRIIENLKEFGDTYFTLSEILRIPAPEYRAIQTAIEDEMFEFDGRRIPINRENSAQLIEAIQTLRGRLEKEKKKVHEALPVNALQIQLDRAVRLISGTLHRCKERDRDALMSMIEEFLARVQTCAGLAR